MQTNVGILTYISRINGWLWCFKPEISMDFGYFNIYDKFKFCAQLTTEHKIYSVCEYEDIIKDGWMLLNGHFQF